MTDNFQQDNNQPPFKIHISKVDRDVLSVTRTEGTEWNRSTSFFMISRNGEGSWGIFRGDEVAEENRIVDAPSLEYAIQDVMSGEIE